MRQTHPGRRIGQHVVVGALAAACLVGPAEPPARAAEGARPPGAPASAAGFEPSAAFTYRTVLDRYCVTCHNARLRTAHLTLDSVDIHDLGADAPVWEKVAQKLRTREMPAAPAARDRRPRPTTRSLRGWRTDSIGWQPLGRIRDGRPCIA